MPEILLIEHYYYCCKCCRRFRLPVKLFEQPGVFLFKRRHTAAAIRRKRIAQKFEFVNDFKDNKFSFLYITALFKRVVEDSFSCTFYRRKLNYIVVKVT